MMKRIIFLSITLLGGILINAFSDGTLRPVSLYYTNSSGEKGLTTYIYNNSGTMYKSVWHLMDMSRHSENYYKYDEQGRMTEFYREFSDGVIINEFYHYDDKGRKVKEYFFRSDGVEGTADYQYDKKGLLIKIICNMYKCWFTGEITITRHDKKGIPVEATFERNGEKAGTITYRNDEHGNLIEEIWDFNGQWQQNFLYSYEPANMRRIFTTSPYVFYFKNAKIIEENYYYSDGTKGPSSYQYDKNGNLIKKIYELSYGLKTETTYKYEQGLLKSSQRKRNDDKQDDFLYYHDSRGNLISRECFNGDVLIGYESYFYDGNDRLTKAVYKNMDSWLTGTIVFEHDIFDRIIKGVFTGTPLNAEIDFRYNDKGMVKDIIWRFSDKTEQGYSFIYE